MKAFVTAVVAAIVLAMTAALVLTFVQRPAYQAFTTSGVRLSDPGENRVGGRWTGNPGKDPIGGQHSRQTPRERD